MLTLMYKGLLVNEPESCPACVANAFLKRYTASCKFLARSDTLIS